VVTLSSRNRYMSASATQRERRRTPRAQGSIPVMVVTMRGPMPAKLTDLSLTGCRILCSDLPKFALSVRISVTAYGLELRAEQRWRRGEESGWRFIYNDPEQERLKDMIFSEIEKRQTAETIEQPYRPGGR
jgi:hypothetical protein